jgi:hypothetical protein
MGEDGLKEVCVEGRILYFEEGGKANTDATLEVVRERVEALGLHQVVVASTHGYTAKRAAVALEGLDVAIIAVTICAGFDDVGWTMTAEERASVEALDVTVLTCMHALGDDVSDAFTDAAPNRIVRETLYRFSQGMKVAVEVALMAADAGLLDMSEEIVAVAGTGEGADTALVLKPTYTRTFKQLDIREILAMPRGRD